MPFRYIFHSFRRLSPAFIVFYQTLEILYFPDTRPSTIILYTRKCSERRQRLHSQKLMRPPASPKNSPALPAGFYIIFFLLSFQMRGFPPLGIFFAINPEQVSLSCSACAPLSLRSQRLLSKFAEKGHLFPSFCQVKDFKNLRKRSGRSGRRRRGFGRSLPERFPAVQKEDFFLHDTWLLPSGQKELPG